MPKAWQWDAGRSDEEIRKILKDPEHETFPHYASRLLARTNVPREVFEYLTAENFVIYWSAVKRQMAKDRSNQGRIKFWQEIYRYLKQELKGKIASRKRAAPAPVGHSLRSKFGRQLRDIRREKKMTQSELAQGAGLTQQFVSKIEQGTENISLDTVERIQKFLKKELF